MGKRYSAKFKFQVVQEALTGDKTPGQTAKAYGIHPNTLRAWKEIFLEKGPELQFGCPDFPVVNDNYDYDRRRQAECHGHDSGYSES